MEVFIDLQKAFDYIDWTLLYRKLQDVGCKRLALQWIQNYFDDEAQIPEI